MLVAYPLSWLRFLVAHLHCNGRSVGFRIERLETLSLQVLPLRLQRLPSA